jgi:hypothetical protein
MMERGRYSSLETGADCQTGETVMILIIPVVLGLIGAFWAKSKNLSAGLWGILCFILPVIGLVILAFKKADLSPEEKLANAIRAQTGQVNS